MPAFDDGLGETEIPTGAAVETDLLTVGYTVYRTFIAVHRLAVGDDHADDPEQALRSELQRLLST